MSETISPRAGAFDGRAGRIADGEHRTPLGYSLLIALVLSAGLWTGIGFAIVRFWL